ncbi:RNA polymerase sigma factor RpoH [Candidatus Mesenet endosymbiont of Agriotes lineatus]|uniref:RNA polymerase sigma factor RpoH n=1 Tax=Candidatus Mesenet endosymbiont of Agriotes lineatus TaxID=3077948 RepID=UPI0030CBC522
MLMSEVQTSIHIDGDIVQYMRKVQAFPMLSQEDEIKLAKNWYDNHDMKAAHKLITSHLRFVVKIAMTFKNYGLSLMEMIMEGNIGLIHAVKKFNPNLGFRFSTYAIWWVKASIKEYVLKSWSFIKIGTTQAQRKLFFSLRKTKRRILGCTENGTLSKEKVKLIADECSVSEQNVIEMNDRLMYRDKSLNSLTGDSSNRELQDIIASNQPNQETVCVQKEEQQLRSNILNAALSTLNERARDILTSRHLNGKNETLETLSKRYNVSKERIRQIEEQAIAKIKKFVRLKQESF